MVQSQRVSYPTYENQYSPKRQIPNQHHPRSQSPPPKRRSNRAKPLSNDDIPLAFLAYKSNRPMSLTLSPAPRPTTITTSTSTGFNSPPRNVPYRPTLSPPLRPADRPRLTPSGHTYNERPSRRPVSFAYNPNHTPTNSFSTPRQAPQPPPPPSSSSPPQPSQPKRSLTAPNTPLVPSPSQSTNKKRTSLEKAKSWLSSRRQAIKLPF
ncbi:hypothetical protein F4703DRAFT_1825557 [Phycomyces blakesleeanus]